MRHLKVADASGEKTLRAEWLASFTMEIGGERHRFAVTRLPGFMQCKVTHRASGYSMGTVESKYVIATIGDYKRAGKMAMRAIIEDKGEARVASAIRRVMP